MTRLLVTGALGHIGSAFIHSARPGQYEDVTLLDNLATQRYGSLFHLPAGIDFRFVEADILDEDFRAEADVVIHLAAITNAAGSFEIESEVERVNFEGTARVAEACQRSGARLVFLSTTSVYGTAAGVVDENSPPTELKPQSPYAESKLKSEQLLASMRSDLRFVILRFGTIFGVSPGMRFHTAINKFVWQACMGLPITVWTTALHQKRPYLELVDAVRALHFAIANDLFDGEVYNVLSANLTVNDVVDSIHEFVPSLQLEYVDSPIMNQLSYEVARAKFEHTGFNFQGELRSGVEATVALLRNANAGAREDATAAQETPQ